MKTQKERHKLPERYRRRRTRCRSRGRVGITLRVLALLTVCILPFLALRTAAASQDEAQISIQVESGEILLGQEMPQLTAKVQYEGSLKVVLDKNSKFTAADLFQELQGGKGYTISCEADTQMEGEYPVSITLEENIRKAIERKWIGLVNVEVKPGVFVVKNPVGQWEGGKFKRYDGTYITEDFVVSKGDTYYFDANGNKVTGWQEINAGKYYFAEDGKMQKGWLQLESEKYFLGEDGNMIAGWMELDGAKYYFAPDGKMVTGEQTVGAVICVFDQDGKLVSEKAGSIDSSKPMVALTFDDGPGPRTGELLNAFAQYNARGTFFMLGQKVVSHGAEVQRMKELGCELGNHSYDHADLSKLGVDGVQNEVGTTNQKIAEITGAGATVMRPPYGAISDAVRAGSKMPLILWNIDTLDWKTRNAQKTVQQVMSTVKDGDIILMHDIHTESIDAAIQLIPMLQQAGYQLVTVSELAAAKGQVLQNGMAYRSFK